MATAMEEEEESFEAFEEADFITLMPKETIVSQVGCLRSLYELRARIGSNARDARDSCVRVCAGLGPFTRTKVRAFAY